MRSVITALIGAALSLGAAPSFCAELPAAEIYVLGEEHDAPEHHLNQARWIAEVGAAAVVFEMLPPGMGPVAMAGGPDLGAALAWEERGWGDFAAYAPIFDALGNALVLGAEAPRAALMTAISDGAAAGFGSDGFGLGEALPPEERAAREAEQDAAHCGAMPAEMLGGMVEAQRLRDALLAEAALEGLERTGGPVAVITGNGHARVDRGVPALIAKAAPEVRVFAVGQVTGGTDAPFDLLIETEAPAGREGDPCDALR